MKYYCVYILTNKRNTVLYTGVTNDLKRRIMEHREGKDRRAFSFRYKTHKLVWYECGESVESVIEREKQIKAGKRKRKIQLIESKNPQWKDLFDEL